MNRKYGKDFINLNQAPYYKNINEIFEQSAQLHACETLFGDWDAEVMILAQDAANFSTLENIYKLEKTNPFRHDPLNNTNVNLFKILRTINLFDLGDYLRPNNRSCGLYYANAIWLIKNSKGMDGAIKEKSTTYEKNKQIFTATLNNLSNLKLIVTLGNQSYNFLNYYLDGQINHNWHDAVLRNRVQKVESNKKSYFIGSIYHTSNRGMISRARKDGYIGSKSLEIGISLTINDMSNIFKKYSELYK